MAKLADETNGPNNSALEHIELLDENLYKKDQPDEPNKIAPSTINGNHDNETKNGSLNPDQIEHKTEESLVGKVTTGCTDFFRSIHRRYIMIIVLLSLAFLGPLCYLVWYITHLPAPTFCPKYWLTYEGTCYYFSDVEGTWNSSQKNCSVYGASLVLVATPEELAFVRRYRGRTDYWIGLRRDSEEESWKWPNGSVFNNLFEIGADGLCAYLNDEDASSTWCNTHRNWICSKFLHAPL